jgi:4,5-dihydroxyphthalate decarboxylase
MSNELEFTMAISHYDHVDPLISGEVEITGTSPLFFELPIPEMFRRFITHQEWEVSEMSSAQYVSRRAAGDDRVVALPVFTSRLFRHSSILVRRDRIHAPEDLCGKRIGVPEWTNSAGVWARGMLSDMYGVKPRDVTWFQAGIERPGRPEVFKPPALSDDVSLTAVPDRSLEEMLYAGDLDAVIAPQYPGALGRAQELGDDLVGRLFQDSVRAEAEYLERTGMFPIMHVVGLRRSFHEAHPWLAVNLYRAFEEAKRRYFARLVDDQVSRVPLPGIGDYVRRIEQRFGGDPWPYGLEANRGVVETIIRYQREQGLIDGGSDIAPEDLFVAVETLVDTV